MRQKEVDASFIQYCKDHNFSAKRVALFMKKEGYSEHSILHVYKKLYGGEPILRPSKEKNVPNVVKENVYQKSYETKRFIKIIKANQFYITLFAFMLLGFFFSTFYILTAFMHWFFGVIIVFSAGYLSGILLYNIMRVVNVSANRHFLASMVAPFCGLAFIAASGYYFSALRNTIIELYNTLGSNVATMDIVIAVLVPLNPIFAMILFYIGFNFHTFYRLHDSVSKRALIEYLFVIPIFLFALLAGWGIFHLFLKELITKAVFG